MTGHAGSLPKRVLEWLKGGYPHGVPEHDYIALLGILHRQLTDVEVTEIAADLAEHATPGSPITEGSIRAMIDNRVHEHADDESTARVSKALADAGWALTPD